MADRTDEQIRAALGRVVAQTPTSPTVDDILHRTADPRPTRRPWLGIAVAVAVVLGVVAAVVVLRPDRGRDPVAETGEAHEFLPYLVTGEAADGLDLVFWTWDDAGPDPMNDAPARRLASWASPTTRTRVTRLAVGELVTTEGSDLADVLEHAELNLQVREPLQAAGPGLALVGAVSSAVGATVTVAGLTDEDLVVVDVVAADEAEARRLAGAIALDQEGVLTGLPAGSHLVDELVCQPRDHPASSQAAYVDGGGRWLLITARPTFSGDLLLDLPDQRRDLAPVASPTEEFRSQISTTRRFLTYRDGARTVTVIGDPTLVDQVEGHVAPVRADEWRIETAAAGRRAADWPGQTAASDGAEVTVRTGPSGLRVLCTPVDGTEHCAPDRNAAPPGADPTFGIASFRIGDRWLVLAWAEGVDSPIFAGVDAVTVGTGPTEWTEQGRTWWRLSVPDDVRGMRVLGPSGFGILTRPAVDQDR